MKGTKTTIKKFILSIQMHLDFLSHSKNFYRELVAYHKLSFIHLNMIKFFITIQGPQFEICFVSDQIILFILYVNQMSGREK